MTDTPCVSCERPVADSAYICERCTERVAIDLGDVGAYSEELRTTRHRQSRTGGAGIGVLTRSQDKPLPWDQHAAEVADALRATLLGWTKVVVEERGIGWPAGTDSGMASFLLLHLEWLRHHAAADEFVDEVHDAVGRARAAVDSRGEMAYAGPCRAEYATQEPQDDEPAVPDACCVAELYVRSGSNRVRCRHCATDHDVPARQRWLRDQVRDQLAPASAISRALSTLGLPLPVETLRSWVKRERLIAHGVDLQGRALYNVGEAADLQMLEADRRAQRAAG